MTTTSMNHDMNQSTLSQKLKQNIALATQSDKNKTHADKHKSKKSKKKVFEYRGSADHSAQLSSL